MIRLRRATFADSEMLLRWRNDPVTRQNSHSTAEVDETTHKTWLAKSLSDSDRVIFIGEIDGISVGTVRCDLKEGGMGYLSWTVAPEWRGRGYGTELVRCVIGASVGYELRAEIKAENLASLAIARRAGMSQIGERDGMTLWRHVPSCSHSAISEVTSMPSSDVGNGARMNCNAVEIVERFWQLMAANDFLRVGAVLSEDYVLEWPQSKQRIPGKDNFAMLNAKYFEYGPWRFTINRIVGNEVEVVTDVMVTNGIQHARVISFFTIEDGKITRLVEFWPENYAIWTYESDGLLHASSPTSASAF